MSADTAQFAVGDIIHHRRFGYRGVVVDVDPQFLGSESWYETMARSRPPKDKPWYHVLVDGTDDKTYVAERHLEPDSSDEPVSHPEIEDFLERGEDGHYHSREWAN